MLANGNVFVTGGMTGTTVLNSAAIYNPASGTGAWTAVTATMSSARRGHTATLLAVPGNATLNNKVLIVGGNSGGTTSVATVQLFDGTSTFTTLTALSAAREAHTATALANGNVLVTGGKTGSTTLQTTLLFNAASGTGSRASAGNLVVARQQHTATLLPAALAKSGQVLVVGGSNGTAAHGNSELWNGTSTWTLEPERFVEPTGAGSHRHAAGQRRRSITGGFNSAGTIRQGQVYDPSFAVACTSNSQCSSGFCVSGVCCNAACTDQCSACNLPNLVGTCSPKANGSSCVDTNLCTQSDTCQAGVCTSGSAVACTGADPATPSGRGACNRMSGAGGEGHGDIVLRRQPVQRQRDLQRVGRLHGGHAPDLHHRFLSHGGRLCTGDRLSGTGAEGHRRILLRRQPL